MDRYEEAMARFKEWERKHPNGYVIREMAEYVFPDLAESEDERIRKELWEHFRNLQLSGDCDFSPSFTIDDVLAYLERQKEQQPAEWSEEEAKDIDEAVIYLRRYAGVLQGGNTKRYVLDLSDRLENLRPQPHWKPSEEQLDALTDAIMRDVFPQGNIEHLESLYNDLKKLM